ncbi:hypothetical protein MUTS16_46260 [Escherichia coli]|nr:hypothetical protein MUTS16_46260 [Escherichia coli]
MYFLFPSVTTYCARNGKNGGGVILTITSMAAENKNINMTSYASSKAAASHLVRNMAFDLGEKIFG